MRASPDPSEGGEQKLEQISLHAVRAPLLRRGWGRLPFFCSETRVFHQNQPYFTKKLQFFVRISRILPKNCSFSSEIVVFYQKTAVFHHIFSFSAKKLQFFIIFFRFLLKNSSFSSYFLVFYQETAVFRQKLLYSIKNLQIPSRK